MFRAYKYRIYPTPTQEVLLNKHFGACRFVYNLALETKQLAYLGTKHNLSRFDLGKQLTILKKESEFKWLKEINSQSLFAALLKLDNAYLSFFKKNGFPRFKNKHGKQSFHCPQHSFIEHGKLSLNKFRDGIDIVLSRPVDGKIKTVTIIKTPTGKYYASILVDTGKEFPKKEEIKEKNTIGVDLGLKSFAVTSNEEIFEHPKHLQASEKRLAVLQRRLSRKKKGSNNRNKARQKVALIHERITNQRADYLHKLSTKLIRENQTICIEDLNVMGMIKNHNLAKSISGSGWGMFAQMLKYKADWYGKNVLKIGMFEPSTKTCSVCQSKNDTLTLADREWVCANCGTLHDRDINAAKNIKAFALRNTRQGVSGEPVKLSAIAGAKKQE